MEQLLHPRDLYHSRSSEGIEWVVGETALAYVTPHVSGGIIGGEARERHLLRPDETDAGAERILLAYSTGDDFLKIHLYRAEEVLGEIGTMEAHRFVGVGSIVIVPVKQRRRGAGGQLH